MGQEHGRDRSLGGEMIRGGCKSLRGGKSLEVEGDSSAGACAGHEYGAGTKGGCKIPGPRGQLDRGLK